MTTSTNAVVYTEEDELIYASKNDSYYLDPSAKQIGGSVIFAFIKSLDIRADLTQMKTPIVFDCGISTLERVAQVSYPNEYVVGLSKLKSPVERMLRILKISLASQIGNVNLKPNAPSKPFNPVLGEIYSCTFAHSDDSHTVVHAEQISHHPPITAVYAANRKNNYETQATFQFNLKLNGMSMEAKGLGRSDTSIYLEPVGDAPSVKEDYQLFLPSVMLRGLLIGTASFELGKDLKLTCPSTGLEACMTFKKGGIVKGELYELDQSASKKKSKNVLYTFEGNFSNQVYMTEVTTKSKTLLIDTLEEREINRYVQPLHKQRENESRRVWHPVTLALTKGDQEKASQLKHEIEEVQRSKAKLAKANGTKHVPALFVPSSEVLDGIVLHKYIEPLGSYTPPEAETIVDELD